MFSCSFTEPAPTCAAATGTSRARSRQQGRWQSAWRTCAATALRAGGAATSPVPTWPGATSILIAGAMARRFPGAAIHLGGHSSAAGLLVNALAERCVRTSVASLALLAPHFGYHAALEHGDAQFGAARVWPFAVNWFSRGRLAGGVPAVDLDFGASPLARRTGCVSAYSVNMALAVTPSNPGPQLAGLNVPIWAGLATDDEVIDPTKAAAFLAQHAPAARVSRLEAATHLGAILDAGPALASALLESEHTCLRSAAQVRATMPG